MVIKAEVENPNHSLFKYIPGKKEVINLGSTHAFGDNTIHEIAATTDETAKSISVLANRLKIFGFSREIPFSGGIVDYEPLPGGETFTIRGIVFNGLD